MLILAQEAMQLDEIARPREGNDFPGIALGKPCQGEAQRHGFRGQVFETVPYREVSFAADSSWKVLAALPGGHPAVAIRTSGKGRIYYIGVRFPNPGDEARLLASLAADCGIAPTCETQDPDTRGPVDGIEVQAARTKDGDVGFVIANRTLSARAVRFLPRGDFAIHPHVEVKSHAEGAEAPLLLDITRKVMLAPDADGAYLLLLEPGIPVVLRCPVGGVGDVPRPFAIERYSDTLARIPAWLAEHTPKAAAKAFSVDPARVRFLDLRAVANRSFTDKIAGDGEGGWTDQGENHLRNAPWGVTDCNGVPFDFIRPDQNNERACVILRSTHQPYLPDAVRGIAVNLRAESLYFLHAGAWISKEEEAFRYVVRYADGTSLEIPMRCHLDFDDWWVRDRSGNPLTSRCRPGWVNSEGRGFHVLRWENPNPEKTIATIDIESACTGTIPIIEAITAELPDESPFALRRLQLKSWAGVTPTRIDGALELSLDDATKNWAGANLILPSAAPFPVDPASCDLVFEANGGRTPLGQLGPGNQPFQISVVFRLQDGSTQAGSYIGPTIEGGAIDEDPLSWQIVRLPIRRLLPKGAKATGVTGINIQYRVLPDIRAALRVRSIRLEAQAAQK